MQLSSSPAAGVPDGAILSRIDVRTVVAHADEAPLRACGHTVGCQEHFADDRAHVLFGCPVIGDAGA